MSHEAIDAGRKLIASLCETLGRSELAELERVIDACEHEINKRTLFDDDTFTCGLITLEELESRYVRHVLGRVGGNKTATALVVGIDRRSVYRRLETPDMSVLEARRQARRALDDVRKPADKPRVLALDHTKFFRP